MKKDFDSDHKIKKLFDEYPAPQSSKLLEPEILFAICSNIAKKRKFLYLGLSFTVCVGLLGAASFLLQYSHYIEKGLNRSNSSFIDAKEKNYLLPNGTAISPEEYRDLQQSGQIEQIVETPTSIKILKIKLKQ